MMQVRNCEDPKTAGGVESFFGYVNKRAFSFPLKPELGTDRGVDVAS